MGKRGPKKGQGGRPHGGKHSEEQRCEWRLRKTESERKKAMRETERKQLHKALKTAAAELESVNTAPDKVISEAHTTVGSATFSYFGQELHKTG